MADEEFVVTPYEIRGRVDHIKLREQFGVKDDQPARLQALKLATAQAKTHAEAMASVLNVRVGAPVFIEEGTSVRPFNTDLRAATPTATTPIETGVVDVRANVTVQLEILP